MADIGTTALQAADLAIYERKQLALDAAASAGLAGRFDSFRLGGLRGSVATAEQFGFLNVVEGLTDESMWDLPEVLERIDAPVHPTIVATSPSDALIARLHSGGYEPAPVRPIAYLRLDATPHDATIMDQWQVREVHTRQDALLFEDVLDAGYAATDDVRSLIRAEHALPEIRGFLAFDDSQPAAAAAMSLHGNTVVLGGASTLAHARGTGAQTALLRHRLHVARTLGCSLATATAAAGSPSLRNLARLGFTVVERTAWRRARTPVGNE